MPRPVPYMTVARLSETLWIAQGSFYHDDRRKLHRCMALISPRYNLGSCRTHHSASVPSVPIVKGAAAFGRSFHTSEAVVRRADHADGRGAAEAMPIIGHP